MISISQGFLREDRHLAAAIWRHFFAMDCDDPQRIELLVYYVRKQVRAISTPSDIWWNGSGKHDRVT